MRLVMLFALAILLSGCAGKEAPTLSGGKPVSYWVEACRNPDPKMRKKAVFKLGNVGASDAAVLPTLIGTLKDADAGVRCDAILALLKCGADAKDAIPALTDVQRQDRNTTVRAYAAKALEILQGSQMVQATETLRE